MVEFGQLSLAITHDNIFMIMRCFLSLFILDLGRWKQQLCIVIT